MGIEAAIIGGILAGGALSAGTALLTRPDTSTSTPKVESAQSKNRQANLAMDEQRRRAAAAKGRSGTILTSPLGSVGDSLPGQRKTLLGQ